MEKYKWLIIKAGLLLFALFIFSMIHWPMIIGLWENKSTLQSYKLKVEEARSWEDVTSRLEQENKLLKTELTALNQKVLKEDVLSGILKIIQSFSQEAGVQIVFLKPRIPHEFEHYQQLTVDLGLEGKYHNVGKYLHLVESSENIMAVQSLEIKTKNMVSRELSINLKISIFLTKR